MCRTLSFELLAPALELGLIPSSLIPSFFILPTVQIALQPYRGWDLVRPGPNQPG